MVPQLSVWHDIYYYNYYYVSQININDKQKVTEYKSPNATNPDNLNCYLSSLFDVFIKNSYNFR
jgi:hypothetical protein